MNFHDAYPTVQSAYLSQPPRYEEENDNGHAQPFHPPTWGCSAQQPMWNPWMMNAYQQFYPMMMPPYGPQVMQRGYFPPAPYAQNAYPAKQWPMYSGSQKEEAEAFTPQQPIANLVPSPPTSAKKNPASPRRIATANDTTDDTTEDIPLAILAYRMGNTIPSEADDTSSRFVARRSSTGSARSDDTNDTKQRLQQQQRRRPMSVPPAAATPAPATRTQRPLSSGPRQGLYETVPLGIVYESDETSEDMPLGVRYVPSSRHAQSVVRSVAQSTNALPPRRGKPLLQEMQERETNARMEQAMLMRRPKQNRPPKMVMTNRHGSEIRERKSSFLSDSGYGSRNSSFDSVSRASTAISTTSTAISTTSTAISTTTTAISTTSGVSASTADSHSMSSRVGGWFKNKTRKLSIRSKSRKGEEGAAEKR